MKLIKEIADKFIIEPKSIELNIYTDIDLDAAKVLYKSKLYKLDLSGIKKINIDILKLIVKYKGWLILDEISEINEKETSLFELNAGTLCT